MYIHPLIEYYHSWQCGAKEVGLSINEYLYWDDVSWTEHLKNQIKITEDTSLVYVETEEGSYIHCHEHYSGSDIFPIRFVYPHEAEMIKTMAMAMILCWDTVE